MYYFYNKVYYRLSFASLPNSRNIAIGLRLGQVRVDIKLAPRADLPWFSALSAHRSRFFVAALYTNTISDSTNTGR
jgi:hypothetical protein